MSTKKTTNAKPAAARSLSIAQRLSSVNRWRDSYNPLRGLTITRAISLLESYARGEMTDLQWTYFFIEQTDPDLLALIERRGARLAEMDWNITQRATDDANQTLADEQAALLREKFDKIENLTEAIDHLSSAAFRGFAHCEKQHAPDGTLTRLEPIDQWNLLRDGLRGEWKYNPEARSTSFKNLPDDNLLPKTALLSRYRERHINRIALVKFVRTNLNDKDWDAFNEIYGIPGGVLIGPPNLEKEREYEFEDAAAKIAEGGSGFAPHGSQWTANDAPRGSQPFSVRLEYLTQKLILAGTGGLLTMLSAPGSGTLAGNAHSEVFEQIAKAEARRINDVINRDLTDSWLRQHFPGRPTLAYFSLGLDTAEDLTALATRIATLYNAGLEADPDELSEKFGLKLTRRPPTQPAAPLALHNRRPAPAPSASPEAPAPNDPFLTAAAKELRDARAKAFAPLYERLSQLAKIEDEAAYTAALQKLRDDLPELQKQILAKNPELETAWQNILGTALADGIAQGRQTSLQNRIKNREDSPCDWDASKHDGNPCPSHGGGSTPKDKSAAPKRITTAEANTRLAKGEKVTSSAGKEVNFGQRLKTKLDSKPEYAGRKQLLDFGQEAVRSGTHTKETTKGQARDYYAKLFDFGDKKEKGTLVIVDAKDGEAFNIFKASGKYLRQKSLLNREGHLWGDTDELPSVAVIRAIVAANRTADCPKPSPSPSKSQLPTNRRKATIGTPTQANSRPRPPKPRKIDLKPSLKHPKKP